MKKLFTWFRISRSSQEMIEFRLNSDDIKVIENEIFGRNDNY